MSKQDNISSSDFMQFKENMQSSNNVQSVTDNATTLTGTSGESKNLKKPPPPPQIESSVIVDSPYHSDAPVDSKLTVPGTDALSDATVLDAVVVASSSVLQTNNKTVAAATLCTSTLLVLPTYQSSEESVYYVNAKALLQSGDFEAALSTIEQGIEWTKQKLIENAKSIDHSTDDSFITFHESMAPFHYLYGTTLLYSIEESPDDGLQPLTTIEGQPQPPLGDVGDEEDDDDDDDGPYIDTNNPGFNALEQQAQPQEMVEDMEIAWENLDSARIIVEQMLQKNPTSDKLRADMGQILLREGDLQRQNGAYEAAITDYTSCLSYYENNCYVLQYSRKVADVHCLLGSVYFNAVVEMKKVPTQENNNGNQEIMTTQQHSEPNSIKKITFHRNRGFFHYYECAKTLVGIIAEISRKMDPIVLFQEADRKQSFPPNFYNERDSGYPTLIRSKLCSLVEAVTTQSKSMDIPTLDDSDLIVDSLASLEEIQETIDEAETSEQGVVEATAMREEISALVSSQQHNEQGDENTVGCNLTSHNTVSTNGFGSAAAAASTAIANPIMIIKKKKKATDQEIVDEFGMDVKLPAIDYGNKNKRMKSSE